MAWFPYLSWWAVLWSGTNVWAFAPVFAPTTTRTTTRSYQPPTRRISAAPEARSSCLFSLSQLVDIDSSSVDTIFVGGKGGVGKTTVSSALAVHLASTQQQKTLIVSTDPAHSLGDCLDVDLSSATDRSQPVLMTDPLTGGNLYALEVDANSAMETFRDALAVFDIQKLAEALQVSPELLTNLGLQELSGLLQNPPPGLDEFIALSNVFDNTEQFDVILVDTAPTGHTLRLLNLPQFLDGLLGKLIKLRMKLSQLTNTLQAFLGSSQANERQQVIDNALEKLETFRTRMNRIQGLLQDSTKCQFVVVTVPTVLGVAESKRLIAELQKQKIGVSDMVVNQCLVMDEETDGDAKSMLHTYLTRRQEGQSKWIQRLQETVDQVGSSPEYQSNGGGSVALTQVPFFDVELVGVAALGYLGSQVFPAHNSFAPLLETSSSSSQKVVICGGKGGVGKTTTSASLAVSMAAAGHKVALISTDPAHSLGDALAEPLSGNLQELPLLGVPNNTGEGSLSAMEVDPTASLNQFKGVVDQLMGNSNGDDASDDSNKGLRDTLKDLQEVFDTLPAGTDEVVALAKIVNIVKKGDFDRIVLDTAPTGHTLRMLSTPGFLADLIERLLAISDKINNFAAVKLFLKSKTNTDIDAAVEAAKSKLLSFQFQMYDLEDLFADAENTEFLIVTVPTELATRESIRLLNDLTFEEPPLKVRNVVVNQVLKSDAEGEEAFLSHVTHSQTSAITDLEQYCQQQNDNRIDVTRVSYLDTEPRGVFGLKVLADALLQESAVKAASTQ